MNIRVIDFNEVTKHFITYQEGMSHIRDIRDDFQKKVEPIRKEMQSIISQSSSGLVLDNMSVQDRAEKFQNLQNELVNIDNDYKHEMKKLHDDLNVKTYDELELIVSEWAKNNNIDLVTGKMEVIFVNDKFDSTSEIIEELRIRNLYSEPIEVEKEA